MIYLQDYYKDKFGKFGIFDNKEVDKYSDDLIVRLGVKTLSRFEFANNLVWRFYTEALFYAKIYI